MKLEDANLIKQINLRLSDDLWLAAKVKAATEQALSVGSDPYSD